MKCADEWPGEWHTITNDTADNQNQNELSRRSVMKASGMAAGIALGGSLLGAGTAAAADAQADRVATWTTAMHNAGTFPLDTIAPNPTPVPQPTRSTRGFINETIRMMPRTSVGGDKVRVRLSNLFGIKPVTFGHVEVGKRDSDGGAAVVPGSNRTVTFNGNQSVTVPTGERIFSDPVDLNVAPEQDLAVSLYMPGETGPVTHHQTARKRAYIATGDHASDTGGATFEFLRESTNWFFLDGIDVVASEPTDTVVCFGDSITDSYNSTLGTDNNYPDVLAERVNDSALDKSVVNAGISGNRVLRDSVPGQGFGQAGTDRFDRDALAQTDVTDVILLEGINDLGLPPATSEDALEALFADGGVLDTPTRQLGASADAIIQGYKDIIAQAHATDVNIIGATLLPFKGALAVTPAFFEGVSGVDAEVYPPTGYYTPAKEERRQQVNEFIRESGAFDGVVDFDAVTRDPENPKRLLPKFDSGDHLHPNDAGYQAMANAVNLSLLDG